MPVIDTSVLMALFNEEDRHHGRAREATKEPGVYVIAAVILQEFLMALGRRITTLAGTARSRNAVREAYTALASSPAFRIQPGYRVEAAGRVYVSHKTLSYADAVAIALARDTRDELLTFDQAQRRVFDDA